MLPMAQPTREPSREGVVLTKATIKAADRLGLSQRILANVLGVSEVGDLAHEERRLCPGARQAV